MRLYFHLVTDRETILDPEGVEVDSVDQALAEALRALDELGMKMPTQPGVGQVGRLTSRRRAGRSSSPSIRTGPPDPVTGCARIRRFARRVRLLRDSAKNPFQVMPDPITNSLAGIGHTSPLANGAASGAPILTE